MPTLRGSVVGLSIDFSRIGDEIDRAIRTNSTTRHHIGIALEYFERGKTAFKQGDYTAASQAFVSALEVGRNFGMNEFEFACLTYQAVSASSVGRHQNAQAPLREALGKARSQEMQAGVYNELCVSFINTGDFKEAIKAGLKIIEIARTIDDPMLRGYTIAAANYNVAEAQVRETDYQAADPYVRQALRQFEELQLHVQAAKCRTLLAQLLIYGSKDCIAAFPLLTSAISVFNTHQNIREAAEAIRVVGQGHFVMGNATDAIASFTEALGLFRQLRDTKMITQSLADIAAVESQPTR